VTLYQAAWGDNKEAAVSIGGNMKIQANETYDIVALLSEDKQVRVTYIKSDLGFTTESLKKYITSLYRRGYGYRIIQRKMADGRPLTPIQNLHYYHDTEPVLRAGNVPGHKVLAMIEEYHREYEEQGYTIVRSQTIDYSREAVEVDNEDEVIEVGRVKYKLAPEFELSVANALEIAAVAVEAGIKQYQRGRQEMYNEFLAYFNPATASSFPKP
jgi:hypothetical protein